MNAYVAGVTGGLFGMCQMYVHSKDSSTRISMPTKGAMIRCRIATRLSETLPDSIHRKNTSSSGDNTIQLACAVSTRRNIPHGRPVCAAVSGIAKIGLLLNQMRMLSCTQNNRPCTPPYKHNHT